MKRWTLLVAAAIAVGGTATHAHHSISSLYDSSRQVTIEGIVAEFQLVNPHPFLFIDVKGRTGEAQRWQLEMDNRRELVSIGVTASTFKPGDLVVVTGASPEVRAEAVSPQARPPRRWLLVRAGRSKPENPHSSWIRLIRNKRATCHDVGAFASDYNGPTDGAAAVTLSRLICSFRATKVEIGWVSGTSFATGFFTM